jgi:hypothetical protein
MFIGRTLKLARKITKNNTIYMLKHTHNFKVCMCIYKTNKKEKLFKTLRVSLTPVYARKLVSVNSH